MSRRRALFHLFNLVGSVVYSAVALDAPVDTWWKPAGWAVLFLILDAARERRRGYQGSGDGATMRPPPTTPSGSSRARG